MTTILSIGLLFAFALVVYLVKSYSTRLGVNPDETGPARPATQAGQDGGGPISVDGIRYISQVDAVAQTDTGRIVLLAYGIDRSVYRATISRETASLIRDRLTTAIELT